MLYVESKLLQAVRTGQPAELNRLEAGEVLRVIREAREARAKRLRVVKAEPGDTVH